MSRMNRWDFLAWFRAQTKARKAAKPRPKREPVAKKTWHWFGKDNRGGQVLAHTRSEARAEVKKALGITRGRLPQSIELCSVGR